MQKSNRRDFIKMAAASGIGIGLAGWAPDILASQKRMAGIDHKLTDSGGLPDIPFVPKRIASWWNTVEDLQWPQKHVVDKIKRRAAAFAEAQIDTAINYGFHIRFDFSNYFGQLHGYMANVCEELHRYDIKFMDHYSCNHVERPRDDEEFKKLHRGQRHHVLLFHDSIAARHAQYEGHLFDDICEVDIRDGSRGYARQYQMETFCHNNPGFLDMHVKYLRRLLREVPMDGIEVDDMCNYAGLAACGCKYCRDRFRRDYGHEIPPFGEKDFWGDTSKPMLQWGNYENPIFRDWLRMKTDSIVDHVKLVKDTVGNIPLMSCCSSTGPMVLNAISLDLEKMAPHLDFFMLENVGTNEASINWVRMDAEALHQKDIAEKRGDSPAMALSYTIYEKGGYLGWCLSRFWGVANWSSTHNQRLEEDPADAMEMEDVISPTNNWEVATSNLDYRDGHDLVEVRLVNNRYCRENGWRGDDGKEHWDRVRAWSSLLVKNNVGYRFLRAEEFANKEALHEENKPLILDGVACVSDRQYEALKSYFSKGGVAWIALPFGTHDEKGFKRKTPLVEELLKQKFEGLHVVESAIVANPLERLISEKKFSPVLKQVSGDKRWAVRIRMHGNDPVIHFMNTALVAIPHPTIKDNSGVAILKDIDSAIEDNQLVYELNTSKIHLRHMEAVSPELGNTKREVKVLKGNGYATVGVDLAGVKVYATLQNTI